MDLQEVMRKYNWISSEFGKDSDFKLLYHSIKYGLYETFNFYNFSKSTPVDQNFMNKFHNTLL